MIIEISIAIFVFALVSSLAWFSVGRMRAWLIKEQQVDLPNERSMHTGSVPRGGGLVISVLVVTALLAAAVLSSQTQLYLAFAALLFCWSLLCWWDDRTNLPTGLRFGVQITLAVTAVMAFGWITQVQDVSLGMFGAAMTVIGILWMSNLYNFMDGIDGIAASQAIVAALSFTCWFFFLNNPVMALVCLVAAAASYGFILWNWQPAKIFMGDVASVTLGAFFAITMILAASRHHIPILSLLMIFGVFILDTTTTLAIRLLKRERFWEAHRQHLYQRFVQLGFSHQTVTLWCLVLMIICSVLATLSLAHRDMILSLVVIEIALFAAHWALYYFLQSRQR